MTMRTNYFLLLAILLGIIPMSYTHANDSIPKSVILYTPYTKSPYLPERQLTTVLILSTTRTS